MTDGQPLRPPTGVATRQTNARFGLVTAGHHFLLRVLPLGRLDSDGALASFIQLAERLVVSPHELDAVLLRTLSVLNRHAADRIPSLVDRYLATTFTPADSLRRFSQCVEDLLRYHCVRHGSVQDAIRFINARYGETICNPQSIADSLGLRLSSLDVTFKRETRGTITEYIRSVRLEHAAIMLATTNKTIKEVWACVGYSHHSNFDHDFKRRFDCTPRDYRTRAIRPAAREVFAAKQLAQGAAISGTLPPPRDKSVLIVDDDETTRTTLTEWLRRQGHSASAAATGTAALNAWETHRPDAVLLDYRLGDMDGVEVLRRMRGAAHGNMPGVAIFTADWDLYERSQEIATFDAMIVSKLCDLDQVGDLVEYLTIQPAERFAHREASPAWKRWIFFG